jgi:hypothetical protein
MTMWCYRRICGLRYNPRDVYKLAMENAKRSMELLGEMGYRVAIAGLTRRY